MDTPLRHLDTVAFELAGLFDGRIYPKEGSEGLSRFEHREIAHLSN